MLELFSVRTLNSVKIMTENIFVVSREEDAYKRGFPGQVMLAAALGIKSCHPNSKSHLEGTLAGNVSFPPSLSPSANFVFLFLAVLQSNERG